MIKIISLCDNINNHKKFWSTEGNSILIETNGVRILYDVGREGEVLKHNLAVLGLSIFDIDYIILSHAHKGHSGALSNTTVPNTIKILYGSEYDVPKFKLKDGIYTPVGNELIFEQKVKNFINAICITKPYEIIKNCVYVFKARQADSYVATQKYWVKKENAYILDFFEEELNVCIRTKKGLIILTGCAHCGLKNIIDEAIAITDDQRIRAIIGGTHIQGDPVRFAAFCKIIQEYNIKSVAPSHCTGFRSIVRLLNRYPKRCIEFNTGKTLTFES